MIVKSRSFRDIGTVAVSRAAGQIVLFSSTIISAKFYGPEAFGVAGVFTAVALLFSQGTSLRSEAVALSSRGERTSSFYIQISYASNALCLLVAYPFLYIWRTYFHDIFWSPILWLLPVLVVALSLSQFVLPAHLTLIHRQRLAGRLAACTAISTAAFQIIGGLAFPSGGTLVVARTLGAFTGLLSVVTPSIFRSLRTRLSRNSFSRRLFRPVWRELIYSLPASLLSTVSFQLPIYALTILGDSAAAGAYWFAFNLIFAPYLVVAASFRPIFARMALENVRRGEMATYVRSVTVWALWLGLAAGVISAPLCLAVVGYLMPTAWAEAAGYAAWLCALLGGLIALTPFTAASSAMKLQKSNFIYNLVQVVGRSLALATAVYVGGSATDVIGAFSVVGSLICVGYLLYLFRKLRGHERIS